MLNVQRIRNTAQDWTTESKEKYHTLQKNLIHSMKFEIKPVACSIMIVY